MSCRMIHPSCFAALRLINDYWPRMLRFFDPCEQLLSHFQTNRVISMVMDQICKFIWILFQILEKIVCVEVCGRVFPAVLSRRIYRVHVVLGANRTADTAFGDL